MSGEKVKKKINIIIGGLEVKNRSMIRRK